jgi:RNA polymerase sigma-70 factor (ECF subfamily)
VYEPPVYRLARHKGLQDADAVELAQEVFVAVRGAIDRWKPDPARGRFRTWLFRIARNLMINFLAAQRRRPQAAGTTRVQQLLEQQAAPDGEDSVLFDREYKREVFRWAAEHVRDHFQEATWKAFWLTAVDGAQVKDVAAQLGVTVGAVHKSRSRVMARLRKTVERFEQD